MLTFRRTSLALVLLCSAPVAASAQTAYLQYSGIVGQGGVLTFSRIPTADSKGNIAYFDGTIDIAVDGTGKPSVSSSVFSPSPPLVTDGFVGGRYYVQAGSCAVQYADLSSSVGAGGSTVWSLTLEGAPTCNGAYPDQATWQTGTPAPDVQARLTKANVPYNPNLSYGITDIGGGTANENNYGAFTSSDGLMAAQQTGKSSLELISYTNDSGTDQPGQTGSVVFMLCANAKCTHK